MLITALRSDYNSPPLTADSVPSPALLASVCLQFQRRFGPDFVDSIFFCLLSLSSELTSTLIRGLHVRRVY